MPADFSTDPAVATAAANLLDSEMPQWLNWAHFWNGLSNDQLMAAMRRVLAADAVKVAAVWAQIVTQLKSTAFQNMLLAEVAGRIKIIDETALICLRQAPLDMLLTVLKGLDPLPVTNARSVDWWEQRVPAVELFLQALYRLDVAGRDQLWDDICPKFAAVHGVLKYRAARSYAGTTTARDLDPGGDVAKWLELKIAAWLKESGWGSGEITMGLHKGKRQPYVMFGDWKLVLDFRAHYKAFSSGEEVLYPLQSGRVLIGNSGYKIKAVNFIPVK